jgi:formamidopyrimidine-DNA glycosylase
VLGALRRLTTRRPLKTVLLDQAILAGVGNIYADESLFAAGIHPLTPACQLEDARRETLSRVLPAVLKGAIGRGGTTLRDYRTVAGGRGENRERLQVYGRAGRPCSVCGAAVEKIRIAGRSAHFCPGCQTSPKSK